MATSNLHYTHNAMATPQRWPSKSKLIAEIQGIASILPDGLSEYLKASPR